MSQQYLESKFTWPVLHVRTPKLTKIVDIQIYFIYFLLSEYGRRIRKPMNKKSLAIALV
jgi:hypothetical protein